MTALDLAAESAHEEMIVVQDPTSGLRAVIALHDTSLGAAVGGTRMRVYASLDDAATDALRLARAMTYKAVMAGMERGGGKAVILGDPVRDKSRALLAAYAKVLDRLGGRFHTGADMGIDARDVAVLGRLCRHVSHTAPDARLETSGLAALGVFASIRAAARALGTDLRGVRVAVQGLGQVGYRLARQLREAGALLVVSDVEPSRTDRAAMELGAAVVEPGSIYDAEVDIFSPNAGGSVLDEGTIPRLRCRAIAGAANEQLARPEDGDALHARGILYGPDYVVNAGGLLSLLYELGEVDEDGIRRRVEAIGDRVAEIWRIATVEGLPPHRVADRMAEEGLGAAREARAARSRGVRP
jgi:leucine dehydrogenase